MVKKAVKVARVAPTHTEKANRSKTKGKDPVVRVRTRKVQSGTVPSTKKKIAKKKSSRRKVVKKKPVTKKSVKRKATKKVDAFPEFPVEKETLSFFSRFFKRREKVALSIHKLQLKFPTLHKKLRKQVKTKRNYKAVKKKNRVKFSIWWVLPPFLRPKHARVVKVANSVELKSAEQAKIRQEFKSNPAKIESSKTITTGIDYLLNYVEEKGKVNIMAAKNKLGISEEIIYEWVSLLENHKFIVVYYPTIGPAELMSLTYAAKHKLKKEMPITEVEETDKSGVAKEKKFKLMFRRKKNE